MSVMMHISSRRASPLARLIAFMALTARLTITLILTAVPMGKIPRARSSLEGCAGAGLSDPAISPSLSPRFARRSIRDCVVFSSVSLISSLCKLT